jgi:molecular chaperone DnaK (HSP70)
MNAFFGLDLGTSQCSIAYVVKSPRTDAQQVVDPTLVELSRQGIYPGSRVDTFPSIVGRDWTNLRARKPLFGVDFLSTFTKTKGEAPVLRRGRDFFTSVKSDMGTNRVYPFSKIPGIQTPREATAAMLRQVADLTKKTNPDLDPRNSRTVLTVPASFSALAREETIAAASDAGFSTVELLDEPVAALLDTLNHQDAASYLSDRFQHVLVFDYGGGTCDLALMRAKGDLTSPSGLHIETLAISPYARIGGDDVDRAIAESILLAQTKDIERGTPEWRALVDTVALVAAKPLKERLCDQLHRNPGWRHARRTPSEVLQLPFKLAPKTDVPRYFELTAPQLEEVMERFLAVPDDFDDAQDCPQSLFRPIAQTLLRARIDLSDLTRVVLHGGSSENPFVREALQAHVGAPDTPFTSAQIRFSPSPIGSVARGAALACYWQHARGHELVAPVVAEPMGIIVSGGHAEQLIAAGTTLPFPNEHEAPDVTGTRDRFFTPSSEHREIVVPYFTGYAGPNQTPRHAGNIKLARPRGLETGTPIRVRLRVDSDKTLRWWFTVGTSPAIEAPTVKDPWTAHVLSSEQRALAVHRRKMAEVVRSGRSCGAVLLIDEANLMRLARQLEDAYVAITDVIELIGPSAHAHNIRALCLDDMGRSVEALADYETAARLGSTNPLFVGNLGCAYAGCGKLDEGVAAIRRALAMDSDLGYLYERLATIARRRGNEPVAVSELKQAEAVYAREADRTPFHPAVWESLSRVRRNLGDYGGAERARQMLTELKNQDAFEGSPEAVIWGANRQ